MVAGASGWWVGSVVVDIIPSSQSSSKGAPRVHSAMSLSVTAAAR